MDIDGNGQLQMAMDERYRCIWMLISLTMHGPPS